MSAQEVCKLTETAHDWTGMSSIPTLGPVIRNVIRAEDKGTGAGAVCGEMSQHRSRCACAGINLPIDLSTPYWRYSVLAREAIYDVFCEWRFLLSMSCGCSVLIAGLRGMSAPAKQPKERLEQVCAALVACKPTAIQPRTALEDPRVRNVPSSWPRFHGFMESCRWLVDMHDVYGLHAFLCMPCCRSSRSWC